MRDTPPYQSFHPGCVPAPYPAQSAVTPGWYGHPSCGSAPLQSPSHWPAPQRGAASDGWWSAPPGYHLPESESHPAHRGHRQYLPTAAREKPANYGAWLSLHTELKVGKASGRRGTPTTDSYICQPYTD